MFFLPIGSNVPYSKQPYFCYTILISNLLVYLLTWFVPMEHLRWFVFTPWDKDYFTSISCGFMHAGLFHLLSNMLIFYIVGLNIEARMGTARFAAFYLLACCFSSYTHGIFNNIQRLVGASGAISALIGAYLVLYTHAKIRIIFFPIQFLVVLLILFVTPSGLSLIFILFYSFFYFGAFLWSYRMNVPAYGIFLFYFGYQIRMAMIHHSAMDSGVSYWAHIGGFAFGVFFAGLFYGTGGIFRTIDGSIIASAPKFIRKHEEKKIDKDIRTKKIGAEGGVVFQADTDAEQIRVIARLQNLTFTQQAAALAAEYENAKRVYPELTLAPKAQFAMGQLFRKVYRDDLAETAWSDLIEHDPRSPESKEARICLVRCWHDNRRQLEMALELIEELRHDQLKVQELNELRQLEHGIQERLTQAASGYSAAVLNKPPDELELHELAMSFGVEFAEAETAAQPAAATNKTAAGPHGPPPRAAAAPPSAAQPVTVALGEIPGDTNRPGKTAIPPRAEAAGNKSNSRTDIPVEQSAAGNPDAQQDLLAEIFLGQPETPDDIAQAPEYSQQGSLTGRIETRARLPENPDLAELQSADAGLAGLAGDPFGGLDAATGATTARPADDLPPAPVGRDVDFYQWNESIDARKTQALGGSGGPGGPGGTSQPAGERIVAASVPPVPVSDWSKPPSKPSTAPAAVSATVGRANLDVLKLPLPKRFDFPVMVLLHANKPVQFEPMVDALREFFDVTPEEAERRFRSGKGMLLKGVPAMDGERLLGLLQARGCSALITPVAHQLQFREAEEITSFEWTTAGGLCHTYSADFSFGWDELRLLSAAFLNLPGITQGVPKRVLDFYLKADGAHLRLWEDLFNSRRSLLDEQPVNSTLLTGLIPLAHLRTPRTVKSKSFLKACETAECMPHPFKSMEEYQNYNLWMLYTHCVEWQT